MRTLRNKIRRGGQGSCIYALLGHLSNVSSAQQIGQQPVVFRQQFRYSATNSLDKEGICFRFSRLDQNNQGAVGTLVLGSFYQYRNSNMI